MKKRIFENVLLFVGLLFVLGMNNRGQACLFVPNEHNIVTSLDFIDYSSIFFMTLGFTIIYYKSRISTSLSQILKKSNG